MYIYRSYALLINVFARLTAKPDGFEIILLVRPFLDSHFWLFPNTLAVCLPAYRQCVLDYMAVQRFNYHISTPSVRLETKYDR